MNEYIDKTKLIADGWFLHRTYQQDAHTMVYESKEIADIPAADVAPVVHGRWIYKPLDKFRKYQVKCSNCDMVFIGNYDAYDEPGDFNFCPNCGARMDEVADNG